MNKILTVFLSLLATANINAQKSKKPNVLIIYTDDLGYGDLHSYGAKSINTPNIDALANNGLKFTNAYATNATCTPSRYSLLTGTYSGAEMIPEWQMVMLLSLLMRTLIH